MCTLSKIKVIFLIDKQYRLINTFFSVPISKTDKIKINNSLSAVAFINYMPIAEHDSERTRNYCKLFREPLMRTVFVHKVNTIILGGNIRRLKIYKRFILINDGCIFSEYNLLMTKHADSISSILLSFSLFFVISFRHSRNLIRKSKKCVSFCLIASNWIHDMNVRNRKWFWCARRMMLSRKHVIFLCYNLQLSHTFLRSRIHLTAAAIIVDVTLTT